MQSNNKLVSVIIPTYNRKADVMRCLASIYNSTYSQLEIIVVDNCSTDGTYEEIVNSLFHEKENFIYVRLKENLMAAGGRNAGIKAAHGDYFLFVDSDNVVDKDMIAVLVQYMERHSESGLVGPVMCYFSHKERIWFAGVSINKLSSKTTYYHKNADVNLFKGKEAFETDHIPNLFMVKRNTQEQVGMFDEKYYIMYEEADFAARVRNAGYKIMVIPDAVTYHNIQADDEVKDELRKLGCDNPERTYHFCKNRSIYMRRYGTFFGKLVYFLFFEFAFAGYYSFFAIKNSRFDVLKACWKGVIKGMYV